MAGGEGSDGRATRAGLGRVARAALLSAAATALGAGAASAEETTSPPVELWLSDAPLARVLEQIAGRDGVRVVVGDGIDQRVSGRLDGRPEEVLATLAVEHGLNVHAVGDTVWFDHASRPVVSLVRLSPAETERAHAALEPTLAEGSVAQRTERGLVLSGSRAFVEDARRRVEALPATPPPAAAVEDAPNDDAPLAATAADDAAADDATSDGAELEASSAAAAGAVPEPAAPLEVRSVTDIPGYDVDYAAESAS